MLHYKRKAAVKLKYFSMEEEAEEVSFYELRVIMSLTCITFAIVYMYS